MVADRRNERVIAARHRLGRFCETGAIIQTISLVATESSERVGARLRVVMCRDFFEPLLRLIANKQHE